MAARVISLLTTGRADWGLVSPIAHAMAREAGLTPRLIVAAAHLDDDAAGLARIEAWARRGEPRNAGG